MEGNPYLVDSVAYDVRGKEFTLSREPKEQAAR